MRQRLALATDRIAVDVDLSRGAEVAMIRDLRTATDVLLTTPWAERARSTPVHLAHPASASESAWMETYSGGWQTLFPHAGAPTVVDGVERHYHGEASTVPWVRDDSGAGHVTAHVELITVPVRLSRSIVVEGDAVSVTDTVVNLSGFPIAYDYQSHPAFGAPFLEKGCIITTRADAYVPDPSHDLGEFEPGLPLPWPVASSRHGPVDVGVVPATDAHVMRFGWWEGLDDRAVSVHNPRIGLTATVSWDDEREFAWLWMDAGGNPFAPWFGRGYALGIEPSTRPTSGARDVAPALAPHATRRFRTTVTLTIQEAAR